MASLLFLLDALLLVISAVILKKLVTQKSLPPPPGPRKLPLIDNLLDMPTEKEWLTFAAWGDNWGDIVSVSVFGQTMIILNTAKVAAEMLDKKSSIYSDRPILQMGGELVGWKNTLVLLAYGERFRNYRKLFHQTIGTPLAMEKFHSIEERETRNLLRRILQRPEALAEHVRRTAGAIILRISHGYEIAERDDPFVNIANEATEQFSLSTTPGGFLVNLVPPLRHVPEWVPGAGFKKTAALWATTLARMADGPHEFVKKQMAAGIAEPSFTSSLLEEPDLTPDREHDIKWSAASLYSGGADTTVSAIYAFFLAMVLHPGVQKKAQAELDSVVGNGRLPSFSDRDSLPYLSAVASEVLRWHAVTPTGVPHRVTEDNISEGFLIPKGAIVISNVWKMLHDPQVYSNPFVFRPERFLGPQPEPDPREIAFGFGRRICPGRVLADVSVFISCAMSLAVFDISKMRRNGVLVEPKADQTTGTISHQKPFECVISPRSPKAVELINVEEF
ncbi:cytochrome P450 [Crepidotus variabilis]|uniref:Cytochrome P450 n=1 Tax=Crepidotus variabilis TaxID=179855 RepID=A0A9P6JRQ2_9AGAR|nr:cytochrome P450 [Crepidotus variabilis]